LSVLRRHFLFTTVISILSCTVARKKNPNLSQPLGIATTGGEEYCILAKFADENAKTTSDNFVLV
jgi:hypothetical protein